MEFIRQFQDALGQHGGWLQAPVDRDLYGERIWVCRSGVLIFPDFFHRWWGPWKGMHGYDPEEPSSQGIGIVFGNKISAEKKQQGKLTEVAATLCCLARLAAPGNAQGNSWVGQV